MPERFKFFSPKGKARKKRLGPSFSVTYGGRKYWEATRKRILVRDNWQCRQCGRVCADRGEAQVDHIQRKSEGGDDSDSNLQVLCLLCHGRKSRNEQLYG
jgi:5-methylcytosine-specific restriction endonuclease McrA